MAAVGALTGGGAAAPFPIQRTEVRFVGPPGMKIAWYGPNADGKPGFGPQYLEAPARYNFLQASIYRLKLSDIPNRPGIELYPTLEVVPAKPKTCTFLSHSAVPIVFTEEDFEQVAAGNFVVKVIYLPDPQFQDLAATGPDEVVSSRLEPGVDPIIEAKRRGSILLVVRLGNIDLEAPNTPSMECAEPLRPRSARTASRHAGRPRFADGRRYAGDAGYAGDARNAGDAGDARRNAWDARYAGNARHADGGTAAHAEHAQSDGTEHAGPSADGALWDAEWPAAVAGSDADAAEPQYGASGPDAAAGAGHVSGGHAVTWPARYAVQPDYVAQWRADGSTSAGVANLGAAAVAGGTYRSVG